MAITINFPKWVNRKKKKFIFANRKCGYFCNMLTNNKDFKIFFQEYFESVYRFSRKYTVNDDLARDITQETFIRLYERRADFKVNEQAKSFVYLTARNLCLDNLRHKNIEQEYLQQLPPLEEDPTVLQEITLQETLRILHAAIQKLPPQSKEIINQSLNGKNNTEIAATLSISVNTVKTLKKNAYNTLRRLLDTSSLAILSILI